jgi:hypothetical protein
MGRASAAASRLNARFAAEPVDAHPSADFGIMR